MPFQLIYFGFSLALFLAIDVHASCTMSRARQINIFSNAYAGTSGIFLGSADIKASSFINKCETASGHYLMLSLGVSRASVYSDTMDISLDGRIANTNCQLTDLPVPLKYGHAEIADIFDKKHSALRTCFFISVTDPTGSPISFKADQPHCKITTPQQGFLNLEGDLCFLKLRPTTQLMVTPTLREECLNPNFLKDNHIEPQDIQAVLNAYVVGDDTGLSTDVDPIGSRSLRWYLSPPQELFPLTESGENENLMFPAEYNVDIHMGEIKLAQSAQGTSIASSLFVDNTAKKNCSGAVCSSPSSYLQPVYGEFELQKINSGKKNESLDIWYSGGMAGPNWQGLIKSSAHTLHDVQLEPGQNYMLSITFTDPFDDYMLFLNWTKQLLIDLSKMGGGLPGISTIEPLRELNGLGVLPKFPSLPSLGTPMGEDILQSVLVNLQNLVGTRVWPNSYTKVCNGERTNCIKSGSEKHYIRLEFQFTAIKYNSDAGAWDIGEMQIKKKSSVFESYQRLIKKLPRFECSGEAT